MDFEFQYRITYASGQFYDRPNLLQVDIPKEEYSRIIKGVCEKSELAEIENIPDAIAKMTELAEFDDRWINMNGTKRSTPLKKPRAILNIEFYLSKSEYHRLSNMKDPITTMERPAEHMTIYRNDGSSVVLSVENGKVKINDSKKNNLTTVIEADTFLSMILHY